MGCDGEAESDGRGGGVDGAIDRVNERVRDGVCVRVGAGVLVGMVAVGTVDGEGEGSLVEDRQAIAVFVGCDRVWVGENVEVLEATEVMVVV